MWQVLQGNETGCTKQQGACTWQRRRFCNHAVRMGAKASTPRTTRFDRKGAVIGLGDEVVAALLLCIVAVAASALRLAAGSGTGVLLGGVRLRGWHVRCGLVLLCRRRRGIAPRCGCSSGMRRRGRSRRCRRRRCPTTPRAPRRHYSVVRGSSGALLRCDGTRDAGSGASRHGRRRCSDGRRIARAVVTVVAGRSVTSVLAARRHAAARVVIADRRCVRGLRHCRRCGRCVLLW